MKLNRFSVLSKEEILEIHRVSLDLLSEVGMIIYSEEILDLLSKHGAQVNLQKKHVKIPSHLVEKSLKSIPSEISLYSRDKKSSVLLGGERPLLGSGHNAIFVFDPIKRDRRPATKKDVGDFARLADALDGIDVVGIQAMPQDINGKASLLHAVEAVFNNTKKHLFFSPDSVELTKFIFDIARVVAEESDLSNRSILTCQLSSTAPLSWEGGAGDALLETARVGVPCVVLPEPYSGVSAPITLAGTLTMHNAEVLSGIVISQLVREGAPVVYGSAWTTFDMRKGNVLTGSPETSLLRIAGAQMADFYKMPYHTTIEAGDSQCDDDQNTWERTLAIISALNSGTDLSFSAGMSAAGLNVSFEQLVLDHEIAEMVDRFIRGITVSQDTIAKQVIEKVGPRGQFLYEEHTLKYLRLKEHWEPSLSSREIYNHWKQTGSLNIVEKANQKVQKILDSHHPDPLPSKTREEISRIVRDFEKEYGN